jgi:hypothetical protein
MGPSQPVWALRAKEKFCQKILKAKHDSVSKKNCHSNENVTG